MESLEPPREADYANQLAYERGRMIDAFAAADDFIERWHKAGIPDGPVEVQLAERLAIRLLVKRFGWRMTAPGYMIRADHNARRP